MLSNFGSNGKLLALGVHCHPPPEGLQTDWSLIIINVGSL